jgi:predicted DNA-binding WGR domain protein
MLVFRFIGWCKDDTHDKVWGVIFLGSQEERACTGERVLIFWGRRGSKLQTKLDHNTNKLSRLIDSKRNKGYRKIDRDKLNQVYPEFQSDLEKTAVWAIMSS